MDLGRTIKQCRKVKKLTLAQLSESSGISISHLCLLEKNKREPSLGTVEAIAKALGVPISVLVFLAAKNEEIPELSVSHIEALSKKIIDLMKHEKN
ncbi:TPA: helix-turn-helix transcriptional regulator [Legionella pneumophila]|nr:helix-turn-helix transcriptional regulator [Legionella pneumophila]